MDKSPDAFRTISEAADELDLPQHVLRYWETRFPQLRPLTRAGNRRYYRPEDIALIARQEETLRFKTFSEYDWASGRAFFWGGLVVIGATLAIWMKRKGWW